MWSRRCPLRIALYECEQLGQHLPPSTPPSCASYAALLQSALDHVASRFMPHSSITLTSFDVTKQQYPAAVSRDFDGVLISGSLSSVYDNKPWIWRLLEEIRVLNDKQVKTCGISFGHQAIAAAMGGSVAPNPQGSEVSVREASLTSKGRTLFNTTRSSFKLHYHHNDAIVKLPENKDEFWVVARGKVTEFQALYKPHHFLTFCGVCMSMHGDRHPDYSHQPRVVELLLELDRKMGWVAEKLIREGIEQVDQGSDYEWISQQILSFYAGELGISPGAGTDGGDGSFVATP